MLRLLLIFLSLSFLAACSDSNQDVNLQERLKKDKAVNSEQIIFAAPQIIDSSHIVIYPLILEKESDGSSYSSGGVQITSYWNLIFYNTETQNKNLLTSGKSGKKVLIYSINLGSSASTSYASANLWVRRN